MKTDSKSIDDSNRPNRVSRSGAGAGVIEGEDKTRGETFYRRYGKRLTDILLSAAGLILLSPLLLLCAILVKLLSPGPVLFKQIRVGRGGKPFFIVKLRTMGRDTGRQGMPITVAGDPRITRLGALLRRWKLDELPQLWNVLKGEMSLVGPRPELPEFVAAYTGAQRRVLAARPGITDPASVFYRDEEKLLAASPEPERLYRERILPHKLELNLKYDERASLFHDVSVILTTLGVLLLPSSFRGRQAP